ncbi:hypothetical protein B0H67DRAFT_684372 [Lasiosphaeris hirsuta]|uniref:Uncharacterized protein n=1 Tax=Lasiosphaeris hirsuta TaxID=260670 RepID=A0AA40DWP8_9PEZI|nr:hypothetical protein B0H67DRAFT_684372 [Lasiosphaeris hirsuta]
MAEQVVDQATDQVADQVIELVDLDLEAGGQQAAGLVERQPARQHAMTHRIDHRGIQTRFFTPGTPLINQDFETLFFNETLKTPVPVLDPVLIVSKFSAVVQGAVNAEDLSLDSNRDWLIILDNVDDLESFDFRELIPQTEEHGAVTLTSRRSDLVVRWDAIEVKTMDEDEATDLVIASTKFADGKTPNTLLRCWDTYHLAIVQAGSFIAVRRPPPNPTANYIELFRRNPRTVLGHKNKPKATCDYRNDTILTTWEISYHTVREKMPRAAQILQMCAPFYIVKRSKKTCFSLGYRQARAKARETLEMLYRYPAVPDLRK